MLRASRISRTLRRGRKSLKKCFVLCPPTIALPCSLCENEQAERKELEHSGDGLKYVDMSKWDDNTPGLRHWNAIMRLRSLVVQVFVRRIRNNHSPKDAAQILFARHPHGSGSGELRDYLEGLPGLPPS